MHFILLATAVATAPIEFTPVNAHLAYEKARELVQNCTPRDVGSPGARRAAYYILDQASAVGADARLDAFKAETPQGMREFTNVYAEFKRGGLDDKWVIVVSHYDTKPGTNCPGANDGASTTGLLIALASAVYDWKTPRGNLMFVWTDGEESMSAYGDGDGLWGSRRAAELVFKERRKVQAVICLDMLGDKDLQIYVPSNGSTALGKIAMHAARKAGYHDLVQSTKEVVKDDHCAFLDRGYKAIDLIDFNFGPNNAYWHTPKDTIDKISEESLLKSGKIVAEMLNILL